jgi:glycosyltransferase involved in cell wall biosynthesis
MTDWLLIAGDFTPLGGMDRANHALATALAARRAGTVHLVAHRVWPDLASQSAIHVSHVARPFGSHLLGAPLLAQAGERSARRLGSSARVVANGGNADTGDVSWVHYVHAAHEPVANGIRRRVQSRAAHRYDTQRERTALARARRVICNSERTARDVRERVGVEASRVRVVYYGSDPAQFPPIGAHERLAARRDLGWPADRPVAVFVGALGDRRKGFDRLLEAWQRLCEDRSWDVTLAVVGAGSELDAWRRRTIDAKIDGHVTFLGFRTDVPRVLAAADLLIHPARYEAYGLGVHEAICRGLPAIVSARAGIAELYPADLRGWLIDDVEDEQEIAERVRRWRGESAAAPDRVRAFSERLRARTWADMAVEFEEAITE